MSNPASGASSSPERAVRTIRSLTGSMSKIQHVVIIFQENRSVNNLFNAFPGADTTQTAVNSQGQTVTLQPIDLTAPYDLSHRHKAYNVEYANGNLNGFDLESSHCTKPKQCPPADLRAYGYVPTTEVKPYYDMASQYTFANRMFQTNQGPSFPAHQYILSGTSTIADGSTLRASENPKTLKGKPTGGCDSPAGSAVTLIDQYGNENQTAYPCFDRNSLIQLVENQSLSWHYYQASPGPGLWHAPDAVSPVFNSPDFATDVVSPPTQVLKDISHKRLANVVWVTPTGAESDHALSNKGLGPSWVASVVNAIGGSPYWNSTAIFVTWDDWGGWYDPIAPVQYNSYELGFRVPLIVISPYAKSSYISTVPHEFGSILKFTEEVFDLGSLGTTDLRADDLSDCFNFSKAPSKFRHIAAPFSRAYFLKHPGSPGNPDDDF
ncbi:MAG: alkaline phosphatase family protein [Candidatus Cybelea sp.]